MGINPAFVLRTNETVCELGNLQSEGHGISNLETMLSIGLGQEQQFTLILQTLQQLRNVYGDSSDKVIQGNANWINAKLATPDGWKRMGDIQVGDLVYTPNGTTTKVLGVYPKGIRPVYKVVLRDGSSTLVCNQHLWEIERCESTTEISEIVDTDTLKLRVDKGEQIYLPKIRPIEYPEQSLPIDPYVLGVLLGDANIDKKGYATLSCKDEEIVRELERRGYHVTRNSSVTDEKCPIYYVCDVCDKLRELQLNGHRSWEKFIPEIYMFGSVSQRIDLLRGLMDTDGTISKKSEMEFVTASSKLAEQVQELIRSLGGRVAVNVKDKVFYTSPNQKEKKQTRCAYRVQNIRLPEINPFLLSRKADRWQEREKTGSGNYGNRVVSVEYMFDDEVQCILVEDARHLFIVDDYIPTHNTSNIVFLKSTDDQMLDTLQKMSGTTHKVFRDSKTITKDMEKLMMQNEGKVGYTMSTKEVPVITFNDMAFISERNSMVFRAGDSPVWNRNETILPMSWKLFSNTITKPGKEFTLQTIPTLSSALDFDVKKNQPDFGKMLDKRMKQAIAAEDCQDMYKAVYGYSDYDIEQLDDDVYADEIMDMINRSLNDDIDDYEMSDEERMFNEGLYDEELSWFNQAESNDEVQVEVQKTQAEMETREKGCYAGGLISKEDLVSKVNGVTRNFDKEIIKAYIEVKGNIIRDDNYFKFANGNLYGLDGSLYIKTIDPSRDLNMLNQAATKPNNNTFAESNVSVDDLPVNATLEVQDAFYRFLAELPSWDFADGKFEAEMKKLMINA